MPHQGDIWSEKPCSREGASASPNTRQPASLGLAYCPPERPSCPSGHNKDFLHPNLVSLHPCSVLGRPWGGCLAGVGEQILVLSFPGMVSVGSVGTGVMQAAVRGEKAFWWCLQ